MNIPGYILRRRLGAGGQAIVYLATQQSLEREVALKVLHPHFATSGEFTARFLNEGRMLANLAHTNVVTIHDIGVAGDLHYLAMELVEGGDLTQRVRAGLDVDTILDYLATIADCLAAAHARHIVHRDIKPCNVLFRRDDTLLLTDFGIAKQLRPGSELTISGIALGSPHYLSPEQAQGLPLDGRADIYSLGAMAYEMFTGERPYRSRSEIDTIFQHVHAPVPRLPAAFARYQPLIDRTMAKAPDGRFASADELADYLRTLRAAPPEMMPEITFAGRRKRAATAFRLPTHRRQADLRDQPTDMHAVVPLAPSRSATPRRRTTAALLMGLAGAIGLALWAHDVADPERITPPATPTPPVADAGTADTQPAPGPAQDRRLGELLALAETALDDLRLTRPEGDNAVFYFRQALAVDGDNEAGRDGLHRVAARYAALATRALEQREVEKARVLIDRGLRVDPDDIDLRTLEAKVHRVDAMMLAEAPREAFPESVPPAADVGQPAAIEGETPKELLNRIRRWFR